MEIRFYEKSSGRSPISEFIDSQSKNDQAAILAVLSDIEESGFNAKGSKFRQLDGKLWETLGNFGKLWEIRIKAPSGGYRFLYVTLDKLQIMILHCFKKKTQKTPFKELNVAKKRLREFI